MLVASSRPGGVSAQCAFSGGGGAGACAYVLM